MSKMSEPSEKHKLALPRPNPDRIRGWRKYRSSVETFLGGATEWRATRRAVEGLAHTARPVPQGEALERVSLILGLARQVTLESVASMQKARRGEVMSRAVVEGVFQLRHRCWNLMLSRPMATLSQNVRSVKLGNYRDLLFLVMYWAGPTNGSCSGRTVEEDCRTCLFCHRRLALPFFNQAWPSPQWCCMEIVPGVSLTKLVSPQNVASSVCDLLLALVQTVRN
jgi:hypothetical protein